MNNAINLLESLGANASLRYAGPSQLAKALDAYETSEATRQAILTADAVRLRRSLTGSAQAEPTQVTQNPWCVTQATQNGWFDEPSALLGH